MIKQVVLIIQAILTQNQLEDIIQVGIIHTKVKTLILMLLISLKMLFQVLILKEEVVVFKIYLGIYLGVAQLDKHKIYLKQ